MKKNTLARKTFLIMIPLAVVLLLNANPVQQKQPEVPYVPTPEKVVSRMLEMAEVGKDDVLYDLGCGDGRIVITAAKELGCRGVGIDIDPQRIEESRQNAAKAGVEERVEFLLMDLFEADISRATVVTLYLLSDVNLRLRPKLLRELKPGTRIVSHDFDMDAWMPDERAVIEIDESAEKVPYQFDEFFLDNYWNKHNVFFWLIPANVTGTWKWVMPSVSGNETYTLKLEQTFQEVQGTAFLGSTSVPLAIEGEIIRGNELRFILETKRRGRKERLSFKGLAAGHSMEGQVTFEGKAESRVNWQAERVPSTQMSIEK